DAHIALGVNLIRVNDGEVWPDGRNHVDGLAFSVRVVQPLPAIELGQVAAVYAGAGLKWDAKRGGTQAGSQRGAGVLFELKRAGLHGFTEKRRRPKLPSIATMPVRARVATPARHSK